MSQTIFKMVFLLILLAMPTSANFVNVPYDESGGCGNPCNSCRVYEGQLCCQLMYYTQSNGWVPLGEPNWTAYLP